MSDQPIRSPIHAAQEQIGGTFDDWDGWLWTTGFGDRDGEYRAVRDGVGAWDVSALIKWDFRGPDALVAADRLLTNDVLGLADGQVRYGAMVDEGAVRRRRHRLSVCGGPCLGHDEPPRDGGALRARH